jgi:hypothetical protein
MNETTIQIDRKVITAVQAVAVALTNGPGETIVALVLAIKELDEAFRAAHSPEEVERFPTLLSAIKEVLDSAKPVGDLNAPSIDIPQGTA